MSGSPYVDSLLECTSDPSAVIANTLFQSGLDNQPRPGGPFSLNSLKCIDWPTKALPGQSASAWHGPRTSADHAQACCDPPFGFASRDDWFYSIGRCVGGLEL